MHRIGSSVRNAMSPSMIVALIALFVALGGDAYVAVDYVPVNGRHNAGSSRVDATGIAANPGVGQTTVVNRAAPRRSPAAHSLQLVGTVSAKTTVVGSRSAHPTGSP